MYNYENLVENRELIKRFCINYRKEFTMFESLVAGEYYLGLMIVDDYKKVMDELSLDEFVGAMTEALVDPYTLDWYRDILDGKRTWFDYIDEFEKEHPTMKIKEKFKEKLKE